MLRSSASHNYIMVIGRGNLFIDSGLGINEPFIEDVGFVEVSKDIHHTAPVPVVSDSPSIVDVARGVHQHLPKSLNNN